MKINERTLVAHATCATPVDKEGWLWKRGEVNKSFQRRYFVLKGNLLFYFERKGDREPVGVVILEGCTIELAEDEQEKFAFKIVFHGEGKRTYVLGTETQETMEGWMKLLSCASYDYMKLIVLELQQQLSELEEVERVTESLTSSSSVTAVLNGTVVASPSEAVDPGQPPKLKEQQQQQQQPQRMNLFLDPLPAETRKPKRSWMAFHMEVGARIRNDRDKWCRDREKLMPLIDLAS